MTSKFTILLLAAVLIQYVVTEADQKRCNEPNERQYGNTCYQFHLRRFGKRNYFQAKNFCQGTLAMVKTEGIQNFLVDQLKTSFGHYGTVLIGLSDWQDKKHWYFDDSEPLGEFNRWAPGQLSSPTIKVRNCVVINMKNDNGKWEAVHCSGPRLGDERRNFICEYKMPEEKIKTTTTIAPTTTTTTTKAPATTTTAPETTTTTIKAPATTTTAPETTTTKAPATTTTAPETTTTKAPTTTTTAPETTTTTKAPTSTATAKPETEAQAGNPEETSGDGGSDGGSGGN